MRVEDVMTREVRTVSPETTLKDVAEILAELRISGLPVVDGGVVVGVVSEGDILAKERGRAPDRRRGLLGFLLEGPSEAEAKLQARTAGEAMTSPAITIAGWKPLAEAAARMIDERVNRLPVVDVKGALMGIVTRADLVRAFVRSDEAIAAEIRDDVVLQALWIGPDRVVVSVDDGAVTMVGHVDTKDDAELLAEFARRVPGVVSVDSRLRWEFDADDRRARRAAGAR